MSLDVFVQFFENEEPAAIQLEHISKIFNSYAKHVEEESDSVWEVVFETGSATLFFGGTDGNDFVDGFMVNRPCIDEQLWKCMYKCLSLGNGVILIPGFEGVVSNRLDVGEHLPEDMLEGIGKIKAAKDANEFLQIVKAE